MIRLRLKFLIGKLVNWSGCPGFVRDCDYEAGIANILISVRVAELFTVINVNGVDIFFHRLTGKIDGIGGAPCALGIDAEAPDGD